MYVQPIRVEPSVPVRIIRQVDQVCDEFEAALGQDGSVAFEHCLELVDEAGRQLLINELALLALDRLRERGAVDPVAELIAANPSLREELNRIAQSLDGAAT